VSIFSPVLDVQEAVMAVDNSAKMGLVAAIVGAVGAIVAAIIPIYVSQRPADPPSAPGKADTGPGIAKSAADVGKKGAARAGSKSGAPGDGGKSKGTTTRSTKTEQKVVPADLARLQGQWSIAEQTTNKKVFTTDDLNRTKAVWQFDGDRFTVVNHGDQRGQVYWRGTIRLHPDLSPKTFDVTARNRLDEAAEMLGIYGFEGPELVLRYRVYTIGKGAKPARPNSFKIELAPDAGNLVRLRRAKQ
jgi:uncharacterized protein (TIGR03067 family)